MVFVDDREEKTDGRRDDEMAEAGSPTVPPEERVDEQKKDPELSGMPALDDGKPTVAPEGDEPAKAGVVPEDTGAEPGEEVVR
jgi:hypothetical protein